MFAAPAGEKSLHGADLSHQSRSACACSFSDLSGCGEWFDLSAQPVLRRSFTFGGAQLLAQGYHITHRCTGCGRCLAACPQGCIDLSGGSATIMQAHCLHCGNCYTLCPAGAVIKEEAIKK
ncbi:4Fe-4S dicluster domain-containing protein [Luoshenia tenuis]|uniref:4Fe-4S dicluster domain-containing protein n=1 Tax=Luoshenia tenuis TaxID=2763654 RepID=UPI003D90297E